MVTCTWRRHRPRRPAAVVVKHNGKLRAACVECAPAANIAALEAATLNVHDSRGVVVVPPDVLHTIAVHLGGHHHHPPPRLDDGTRRRVVDHLTAAAYADDPGRHPPRPGSQPPPLTA